MKKPVILVLCACLLVAIVAITVIAADSNIFSNAGTLQKRQRLISAAVTVRSRQFIRIRLSITHSWNMIWRLAHGSTVHPVSSTHRTENG